MVKGKICIVTGGGSGIGLSVAESFAKEGATVVLAARTREKLKAAAEQFGCDYYAADLSERESNKQLVDYTLEKYGKVDVLINVAGIQHVCPIADFPEDQWDFMIRLMLTSPFLLTKYVWPSMKEQGWGRIINVNSIHGLVASEFKAAYVSAKHGLVGLTKTAGLEGGPLGITVNSICPAYVRTPLVDNQIDDQARSHGISRDEVIEKIMLQKSAIKKIIEPEDIADIAKFLCGNAAQFITGTTITVDGGWTAS